MIFRLDERLLFPDTGLAEDDGLLAVGGDLSVERLLLAYKKGIFPWYSANEPILWFAPHQRFVLFPDELKVSKSMKQVMRSGRFSVTFNKDFPAVIVACSLIERPGQQGTWITEEMKNAYIDLHQKGYAHSVEVWQGDALAGGLYGVQVGKVFCGESMFSRVNNASKITLTALAQTGKYLLIDCQVYTDHLASLGARMISMDEYRQLLKMN